MKKRLIALFLCAATLFGLFPSILSAAAAEEDIAIWSGGTAVSDVYVPYNGNQTLTAMLKESASGRYQWQVEIGKEWVDVRGANGGSLKVNLGLVHGILNDDYQAKLRCLFTPQGGKTLTSKPVTVWIYSDEGVALMSLEEQKTAAPQVTILAPQTVQVHWNRPPADTQPTPETTQPPVTETTAPTTETTAPTTETTAPATETTAPTTETTAPTTETTASTTETTAPATETTAPATSLLPSGPSLASLLGGLFPRAYADETPIIQDKCVIEVKYQFVDNTTAYESYIAELAKGSSFSATVTFPVIQGYLPYVNDERKDSITLNYASIQESETITVVYKPTNVNYTVIHYQQNLNDDGYTEMERETKQGLTGSQVPEVEKSYPGFYHLLYERPAIAADGLTTIEVYYDRYYYLMNFDLDGGYGTEPVYARYGTPIGTVATPTKAGYTFSGWSETKDGTTPVTLPTAMPVYEGGSKTYYAIWTPGDKAKVTVVFWGENADDEGYSYLADAKKEIYLKPGREFTYTEGEMLICSKELHTHTDTCLVCSKTEHTHSEVGGSCYTLGCGHSHSIECYRSQVWGTNRNLIETTKPTNTLTARGNGIFTYTTGSSIFSTTHYYVQIGDKWYCSTDRYGYADDENEITFDCTHTHNNSCYNLTCTTEVHTHGTDCYTCGKEAHAHNSDCYMQGAGLDTTKWKFVKSDTVTVAADDSSVVNVYYDRVEYSVQFYNGSGNTEYTDIRITAKWGASIGDKWPTRNNSGTWAVNPSSNNNVSGPYQVYLQEMPVGGDKFYGPKTDSGTQSAYYYVEILPGETGTETYDGNSYKLHHTDTSPGSGYVVTDDDKYAIQGFTFAGFTANRTNSSYEVRYYYNNAKFYYTRNSYKLTFNDQYTNVKQESVKFEAPLSTYKDYVPPVPSAFEPGSVEFGGWYQNPQCTGEEYKLDEHKMPANDIILYAKWVPVNRTVTFYLTEALYQQNTENIYKPIAATDKASFIVPHGGNIAQEYVDKHLQKSAMNTAKPNGDYTFVMWYYYENGQKKPFDPTTVIRRDLVLFGEWSSNTLKPYTVQFVLKDDHSVKVAADLTGSGLAGTTKTFEAKGGTDLYAAYQEGYFPTVQSQSLLLDINKSDLTLTFEYVPMPAVPYTVKYVEKDTGKSLAADKVVSDNRKAVVTETFKPISGYMPDAYQKRLVVTADGENVLYFYYTKDTQHAFYKITHFTQNTDGETWTEYSSSQATGDIGTHYTASPMTIPGFTYKETKYVVNGTEVTDVTAEGAVLTENGLEINLYYVRNEYPYQVRYLEQGTGAQLADPKNGTGLYGQIISESAIDIDGYDKVDPTSATLNIRIDGENESPLAYNIITFYYKEKEVTINYVAVGPAGATDFGSVAPTTETVKVKTGTAQGSTPTPGDGYKFVGWYKDSACTQAVNSDWVDSANKLTPPKDSNGNNVTATYYAKFECDVTTLTIQKQATKVYDSNERFVFNVTGPNGFTKKVTVGANSEVTITGLKVGGTYTISEDTTWSWRYTVSPESESVTLVATAASNVAVFTNTLNTNKWLTGDAYADNNFTN